MDLDNINDIEELREIAKVGRVQLLEDVDAHLGGYTFKKDYWYIVEQDDYHVWIYSEDYKYSRSFTYKEASKYLKDCD